MIPGFHHQQSTDERLTKWYGKSPAVPDWVGPHTVSCEIQGQNQSLWTRI